MCTNKHQLKDFQPEDYQFVNIYANLGSDRKAEKIECIANQHGQEFSEGLDRTLPWDGKYSSRGTFFQCDHCGSHFDIGAVYLHTPSGKHISMGWQCSLNNGLSGLDNKDFERKQLRRRIQTQKARIQNAIKRAELWRWVSESQDVELQLAFWVGLELTIPVWDVVSQITHRTFDKCKAPSSKQIALIKKHARLAVERHQAKLDEKDNEILADVPVTDERIKITGKILASKWVENEFGGTVKILVKDTEGFKVWGSSPSSINCERGDTITFHARVTPSKDDPTFGFFKRPTKAEVVEVAEEAIPQT